MSYLLPTITSLNRHNSVPVRRSRSSRYETESVCIHRETTGFRAGRCPWCYRNSIRNYGSRIRARSRRPPAPRVVPLPPVVRPRRQRAIPIITRPPIPAPSPSIPRMPVPSPSIPRMSVPSPPPMVVQRHRPAVTRPWRVQVTLPGQKIYGCGADQCSICMATYENDRECQHLPCDHKFHVKCFKKWYVRKNTCPLCRREFT